MSAQAVEFINLTINKINQGEIETFCGQMKAIRHVRGVFFYFHTPYYGRDEREAWNKGKLVGQKPPLKPLTSHPGSTIVLPQRQARPSRPLGFPIR